MVKKKLSRLSVMLKRFRQIQWTIFGAGMLTTFLFAGLYVFKPPYLHMLELKLYDSFLQKAYTSPVNSAVAVVDIDEQSIKTFGHWPWPRYRVSLLLKKIEAAGALAVGNDILFGEPDGTSPKTLQKVMKRDLGINVSFGGLPAQLMDNDALLAGILAAGPFALGYSFDFQKKGAGEQEDKGLPAFRHALVKGPHAKDPSDYLIRADRVIPPLPELLAAGGMAGYMNTITDADGVLRRVPLLIAWNGRLYPHLSLATLLTALKGRIPDPIVKVSRGGLESIKIGSTVIPLEANGSMLINYKGPAYTFPFIPASDVLEERVPSSALKNKIVFLGSSAAGLLDIRVSPLAEVYPGVEVNTTIVDNILNRDFIRRPDWAPGLELLIICVWGLLTTVSIGWAGAVFSLAAFAGLGTAAWAGGLTALKAYHIWISPFFPLTVLVANFTALTLLKFWFSERKKKFYRSAFSRYVSKAVVDQISENPDKMTLAGEEKEITVLFADIRGFTSISERLSPTQVTNLLHDYFTPITRSIIKNHGTLDKFIGDAVMCFWNAPLDVEGHPDLAVRTGFEMLASLEALNKTFIGRYGIRIKIGIGLHTGQCRVGNMGSSDLFDYTIIGDNVNLASRLEGLTKFYGVSLIVSGALKDRLSGSFRFLELDRVRVKGKSEPVGIFTVWPPEGGERGEMPLAGDPAAEELLAYESGLALYRQGAFEKGLAVFEDLASRFPGRKIHGIYKERCAIFMQHPPAENWDGVFTHLTK